MLVSLKRNTPPLLLVLLNYMRLFRLLRLVRLLKVSHAWVPLPASTPPWALFPGTSIVIQASVACLLQCIACMSSAHVKSSYSLSCLSKDGFQAWAADCVQLVLPETTGLQHRDQHHFATYWLLPSNFHCNTQRDDSTAQHGMAWRSMKQVDTQRMLK